MTTTLKPPTTEIPSGRLNFSHWSRRTASLVSGIALAAMSVIAGLSNFGAVAPLIFRGDATKTADAIGANTGVFLAGIIGLFLVTLLDIVVAGAWFALFARVNRTVSAIAAWMRVVFAVLFMIAISQLVVALNSLEDPGAALRATEAFTSIWVTSLGLFGAYLLVIGYLAIRSGFIARIFGILLGIAGIGYLADAIGTVAIPGFTAVFGGMLFVGEVAIIFWLLIRGRRLPAEGNVLGVTQGQNS